MTTSPFSADVVTNLLSATDVVPNFGTPRILDHDDELADKFESYEPSDGDERPVEEYLLERAALARARSERQIVEAVAAARAVKISWSRIGELLGTSAQVAQQRYGALVEHA